MLKKASFRRITIATCALLIIGILYLFPTKDSSSYEITKNYNANANISNIFLLDENNYVAMTNVPTTNTDSLKLAQELIQTLTIDNNKSQYIPNGFKAIIPKNTKINSIDLKDGLLKIDFSKEFLNISRKNEEKLIESIVYSLTSIKDINNVMIFVDGQILNELPNSKKALPQVLNRSIGVNKTYDLESFKNTTQTTIYYVSKYNDLYYYVPITKIDNNQSNKIEIIIDELKSTPVYQTNLMSYLKANAELQDYEIIENSINLSFNEYLFDDLDKKNILEEVKYTILLSLKDNLDITEVNFIVNNEQIDSLVLKNVE